MSYQRRVLFICTANSARSQLAEALLRHMRPDDYEAFSVGTEPGIVDERALAVLQRMNISTDGLRSKSLEAFRGQSFDFVITLCNKAQAECQSLPGAGKFIAWDFEDPTTSDKPDAFMKTLHEIQERIKMFILVNEKT